MDFQIANVVGALVPLGAPVLPAPANFMPFVAAPVHAGAAAEAAAAGAQAAADAALAAQRPRTQRIDAHALPLFVETIEIRPDGGVLRVSADRIQQNLEHDRKVYKAQKKWKAKSDPRIFMGGKVFGPRRP